MQNRRSPLISTSEGTRSDAFGGVEWGLLVGIAVIWGSSFLWIDLGLDGLRPGAIALSRVALGAAALFVVPASRRPVDRDDWPRIALLGLVWIGIPMLIFPIAQQWVDSSVAGMINGAMPLATAAWATVLLRRLPGRTQLVGLAVGFLGVVAISLPELVGSRAGALSVGLLIVAVVLYGLSANLAVPLQQRYGALPVLLRAQAASLVVVAPFGLFGLTRSTFEWTSVLAMIPLGVLSTGLAFVLMVTLVGRVGSTRGSVPIYLVPVVAIALGVAFLGERVAPIALVGALLVIVGAWLTSRREQPRTAPVACSDDASTGDATTNNRWVASQAR